jgi:hypothetical protein
MVRNVLTVLLLISVLHIPALSATVVLSSTNDAGIWQSYPNTNYGSSNYMWVGYNNGFVNSLVEFGGLSSYTGATVNEAILGLYVPNEWGNPPANNHVNMVAGNWNESTITWNNNPGYLGDLTITFGVPALNNWLELDATEIVQAWLDGDYTNNGFYMQATNVGHGGFYFYSKEFSNPVYRPKLTLDYTPGAIEGSSVGEIKAAFR